MGRGRSTPRSQSPLSPRVEESRRVTKQGENDQEQAVRLCNDPNPADQPVIFPFPHHPGSGSPPTTPRIQTPNFLLRPPDAHPTSSSSSSTTWVSAPAQLLAGHAKPPTSSVSPPTGSNTPGSTPPPSSHPSSATRRPQPSLCGTGADHRDRHLRPRLQLDAPTRTGTDREMLKLNGYSTAHFGKCHEVPVWETGPMGPFEPPAEPGEMGSSTSTGSIGRPTSTPRRSTGTRCPSSRTGPRKRVTTSPRT